MNVMAGPKASTEEGRALISATASLVKRATEWVKGSPDAKEEDVLGLHCTYHRNRLPLQRSHLHLLETHEKSLRHNFDRLCSLYPLIRGTENI
jgi:hypothetical protein